MKKVIVFLFIIIFSIGLYAKYSQPCSVKYKQRYGWSQYYQINVTFITGYEIFEQTYKSEYEMFTVYAFLFFGEDKVPMIKVSSVLLCGDRVDKSCIKNSLLNIEGEDLEGREWEICVGDFCY